MDRDGRETAGPVASSSSSASTPTRSTARRLYCRLVVSAAGRSDRRRAGRVAMRPTAVGYLFSATSSKSKLSSTVGQVLELSLFRRSSSSPLAAAAAGDASETCLRVAAAFSHVEQYALNLVDLPWKKEFQVIKVKFLSHRDLFLSKPLTN